MRAGVCAGQRGAPRITDRTGTAMFVVAVYRGVVSVGAVSRGCPAPKQHHPKRRLTRKVEIRAYAPAQGNAQHSPPRTVAPARIRPEGKREQTPSNGDHEMSPGTPRSPAAVGAGSPPGAGSGK